MRQLWRLAVSERATPAGIGGSVAVGVFAGCTPFVGFHWAIAVAAASVLRLNRLWALVGSRISFFLILPWIVLAEVQTAHRLRTGGWAPLLSANAIDHAPEWMLDWCLGTLPVGIALAATLGFVAYAVASLRENVRRRAPAPAPPPSSGSLP